MASRRTYSDAQMEGPACGSLRPLGIRRCQQKRPRSVLPKTLEQYFTTVPDAERHLGLLLADPVRVF